MTGSFPLMHSVIRGIQIKKILPERDGEVSCLLPPLVKPKMIVSVTATLHIHKRFTFQPRR